MNATPDLNHLPSDVAPWSLLYAEVLRNRASGNVKRWHVMTTLREQTVAAHSFGVAMLAATIAGKPSSALLLACLSHDLHERALGDIPSTAKWRFPGLAQAITEAEYEWEKANGVNEIMEALTHEELVILKISDYMELLLWATEEAFAGNGFATEAIVNIIRVLDGMRRTGDFPERAEELYDNARAVATRVLFRFNILVGS